jgi:hypothetical protein
VHRTRLNYKGILDSLNALFMFVTKEDKPSASFKTFFYRISIKHPIQRMMAHNQVCNPIVAFGSHLVRANHKPVLAVIV